MKTLHTGVEVADNTVTGVNVTKYPRLDKDGKPLVGHGVYALDATQLTEYNTRTAAYEARAGDRKKEDLRRERKALLDEADKAIFKIEDDGGNPAQWRTYRKALRDITKAADPFNVTWPTKPSGGVLNQDPVKKRK